VFRGYDNRRDKLSPVLVIELDDAIAARYPSASHQIRLTKKKPAVTATPLLTPPCPHFLIHNSSFCLSPTNVPAALAATIQQKLPQLQTASIGSRPPLLK